MLWQILCIQYILLARGTMLYIRSPELILYNWNFVPLDHHLSSSSSPQPLANTIHHLLV